MCAITPEWISVIVASISAFTTIITCVIAYKVFNWHRDIESNKQIIIRNEILIVNLQSVLVTFANIHATAKEEWSDERSKKLTFLSNELNYKIIVVSSLNIDIGNKLTEWQGVKGDDGNSISYVIHMILGSLGAIIGTKYDEFLLEKATSLRKIQDELYSSMCV